MGRLRARRLRRRALRGMRRRSTQTVGTFDTPTHTITIYRPERMPR